MKVKRVREKVGLKLNIQKTKIMASSPITSWQIDGETVEKCQTLFFGAPKSLQMVTAAMKLKDTPWKESYVPATCRVHVCAFCTPSACVSPTLLLLSAHMPVRAHQGCGVASPDRQGP